MSDDTPRSEACAFYGCAPQPWKAATVGENETLYYGCADCGTPNALIAGFLARIREKPAHDDILVLGTECGGQDPYRLALFCQTCFKKRLAEAGQDIPNVFMQEQIQSQLAGGEIDGGSKH